MSSDESTTSGQSFLAFVGDSLAQALTILKYIATILTFVRFLRKKWRKQFGSLARRQRLGDETARIELRHEMGALSALSKSLERQVKGGNVDRRDVKELHEHIVRADALSKRLEIRVRDPPFDFEPLQIEEIRLLETNEPIQALSEIMFRMISQQSFKLASEL